MRGTFKVGDTKVRVASERRFVNVRVGRDGKGRVMARSDSLDTIKRRRESGEFLLDTVGGKVLVPGAVVWTVAK